MNNKIQSDKDNFLDNLIYEIAIMGVLGSIFRQDNFLTIYERFWHLGGHVHGVPHVVSPRRWRSQNASYLTDVNMHSSVTRQYKNCK